MNYFCQLDSLAQWKERKLRVSWFKIPLVQSKYIPSLVLASS